MTLAEQIETLTAHIMQAAQDQKDTCETATLSDRIKSLTSLLDTMTSNRTVAAGFALMLSHVSQDAIQLRAEVKQQQAALIDEKLSRQQAIDAAVREAEKRATQSREADDDEFQDAVMTEAVRMMAMVGQPEAAGHDAKSTGASGSEGQLTGLARTCNFIRTQNAAASGDRLSQSIRTV